MEHPKKSSSQGKRWAAWLRSGKKKGPKRDPFFSLDSQSVPKTLPFEGQASANINEIKHLYGGSVEIRTLG